MNQKDLILLQELKKDSKRSVQALAKATGLPSTTVYNRLKRLEKEGVIKQYTVKLDNKKTGRVQAFIECTMSPGVNINEFLKKIKSQADEAYSIAGDYQILLKVSFNDLGALYSFVAQLQQAKVEKLKTTVVLDEL